MNNIGNTYNYNDLASLNAINTLGREKEDEALKQVAHQFESMFVGMMLKSMRDANAVFEEDNPLSSNESKFYRQMFDDQLALSMSQGEGIGLASSIYRQLKDQFDVKSDDDTKPTIDIPIRQYQGPNPFSTIKPNLDLQQFNPEAKGIELNETKAAIAPLNESPVKPKTLKTDFTPSEELIVPNSQPLSIQLQTKETGPITKQSAFQNPEEFVAALWPVAQSVGEEMGVEPKAIMAQAALETGWGKYIIHKGDGNNSHNLFGIKADHRWDGDVAKVSTLEYRQGIAKKEVAPFRVYESYEHSLKDYAEFVQNSERYQTAIKQGETVKGYSEGLQNGGYATDPKYAEKIQRIAHGDVLAQAIAQAKRG
ncbi:flagellar assembly peptidoglycan hydrolase FlgJ [Oceaniserpentilla sp. 4NH20-0058]|uniref:flagellar assembly peptidoglycan hydrolase FlgJ n=1 Tax=Oceaniserpentilla sp. 4NH20-0058 TaxID=3127660 RepID=UPI003109DB78